MVKRIWFFKTLFHIGFIDEDFIIWRKMKHLVEILNCFGPQMALALRLDAISQGLKRSQFPGSNPLPLFLVMDLPASNALRINHIYKS